MMDNKILLVGGGGHCKSVLDALQRSKQFTTIGIIDKKENIGKKIMNVEIIGCDDDLPNLFKQGYKNAFVTVGSVGNPSLRVKLSNLLEDIGFKIPLITDPSSVISEFSNIGDGVFIGKNSVINAGVVIGKGAIINTSSTIEHDCIIGEYTHIAPGALLCGDVNVGAYSHIGAKSVVKQQIKIGANTTIGMGSVVLKDIKDSTLAYGCPCKEVK